MPELLDRSLQEYCEIALAYKKKEKTLFKELTLAHYAAFGGTSCSIDQVASAVEQFILALDIIDDIQDKDNHEAPWTKIDYSQSLNIALSFLASSMKQIATADLPNTQTALNHFMDCFQTSIAGQYLDLNNQYSTEEQYLDMCRKKSGALVALASIVGTSLAVDQHHDIVLDYASNIGVAAQIANDVEDLFRFSEKSDWRMKKKPLPIIYLLESGNPNPAYQIISDYFDNKIGFDDLVYRKEEVITLMNDSGALVYAGAMKGLYKEKARQVMQKLPICRENKERLMQCLLKNL